MSDVSLRSTLTNDLTNYVLKNDKSSELSKSLSGNNKLSAEKYDELKAKYTEGNKDKEAEFDSAMQDILGDSVKGLKSHSIDPVSFNFTKIDAKTVIVDTDKDLNNDNEKIVTNETGGVSEKNSILKMGQEILTSAKNGDYKNAQEVMVKLRKKSPDLADKINSQLQETAKAQTKILLDPEKKQLDSSQIDLASAILDTEPPILNVDSERKTVLDLKEKVFNSKKGLRTDSVGGGSKILYNNKEVKSFTLSDFKGMDPNNVKDVTKATGKGISPTIPKTPISVGPVIGSNTGGFSMGVDLDKYLGNNISVKAGLEAGKKGIAGSGIVFGGEF